MDGRQIVRVESGYGYGVVGADLHVWPDQGPVYMLLEHRPEPQAPPVRPVDQPSLLLNTRYQTVGFTGRGAEREELAAWRDAPAARLSVRWLHAPGGQGKTRLAAQFAAESAAAGWKVAHAVEGPLAKAAQPPGSHDMRLRYERGLLLLVDYADRWPVSYLTWLFSNALFHQGYRVRMLLLARSLHPWPVISAALTDVRAETRAAALAPLSGDLGEREQMFTAARDAFAACYDLADATGIRPPGTLERPEFGLVLAVHMAALVAVDARAHGARPPQNVAGLSAYLLNRECAHWKRMADAGDAGMDYGTSPLTMGHAVFTAALTGPMTHERAVALLRGLDLRSQPMRVLADHALCYPPVDPATVLEPLSPDRLAEDYLALAFPGHSASQYPSQPWAGPTARALAARDPEGAPPAYTPRLLTFMAAAAARWPHLATHIRALLQDDPGLAVVAGSAALTALAELPDLDPALLESIEACFPPRGQVDLDPGIAAVTARLAEHRLAATGDPVRRINIHMVLATRHNRAGQYEQAVQANDQALRIARSLDDTNLSHTALRQDLLGVVTNDHGVALMNARRWDEAQEAERQAVEIYRRLVAIDAARYEPSLAAALSHLATSLSHLEQREQALEAEQEAVEIRRRLAAADPAKYEPELASSLHSLGNRLADLGRRREAFAPTEQAVAIRKRLVRSDPDEELGLARSLSALGQRWRYSGDRGKALEAEREAVAVFERLAALNPAAHEPSLAISLSNLSTLLGEDGKDNEALTRSEQALAIRRRLAALDPRAFEPQLAESLSDQGVCLAEIGRHSEAFAAISSAIAIFRRLAETNPAVHEPRLALTLAAFTAISLKGHNNLVAALDATGEALAIYFRLAERDPCAPAAFGSSFRATLSLHADVLQALGRTIEADALRRMLRTADINEVRRMMS